MTGRSTPATIAANRRISVAREEQRRERKAEAVPLHPTDEAELRSQAHFNVKDDLMKLRQLAQSRRDSELGKRIRFLGRRESELLEGLLCELEKWP